MIYVKNISYMLSHVFFMVFLYLFLIHRYSRRQTIAICVVSCSVMNMLDYFKLDMFSGSKPAYLFTTLVQIAIAQCTGLLIAKKRDSRALFISLSASNYVIVGSITASILYILTGRVSLALVGNLLMHLAILLILSGKLGNIFHKFCERDLGKSWWGLCLIPVFFFCSFFLPCFLSLYPLRISAEYSRQYISDDYNAGILCCSVTLSGQ